MSPDAILETCLYAEDLDAARAFWGEVMGLPLVAEETGRHLFFRCGPGMLLIFDPRTSRVRIPGSPVPPHGATGPGHVCLAVPVETLGDWFERLSAAGIAIEAVNTWPTGARSLYFRDPAGNSVELGQPAMWGITP